MENVIHIDDPEIEVLLDDFIEIYGYDFSGYSKASFKRRLQRLFIMDKMVNFAEFRYRLQNDRDYFNHAVSEISVNVTEMFRDPVFFKTIREKVVPVLATYPLVRIWHAGCSSGEEVYSLAIILKEAGILNKSILYGTDLNPNVLEKAARGIFPMTAMQQYSRNYLLAGGREDFSSYYSANYNFAKFDESLSQRMVYSTHNLVSDFSFNSFQLIFCRNVLIYFDKDLQSKVLSVFDKSLERFGFLALGSKESLRFSGIETMYEMLDGKEKIWRKFK
ncbi:MAG: protein-glutamate O-methyltransferase CheR [Chitinophagaceae bacterium]|nr:MAG: protein-glutamate O-methyltransferase CheR [Chitinophagaceae bacterium]